MFTDSRSFARIERRLRSSVLIVAAAAGLVGATRAQTPVVFGDTITSPGLYYLDGDQSGSGVGVLIESDDVTLLLGHHTLEGDGTGEGVVIGEFSGVHVVGGHVRNFEDGIELEGSSRAVVRDVRVSECGENGVECAQVSESLFTRLVLDHNGEHGILLADSRDNRLTELSCHHNGWDGIALEVEDDKDAGTLGEPGSHGNLVEGCDASWNEESGIDLSESGSNVLRLNRCLHNGEDGIELGGDDPGSDENLVLANVCHSNAEKGIDVQEGSAGNHLVRNRALHNEEFDLFDDNIVGSSCPNEWSHNLFVTRGGKAEHCIE